MRKSWKSALWVSICFNTTLTWAELPSTFGAEKPDAYEIIIDPSEDILDGMRLHVRLGLALNGERLEDENFSFELGVDLLTITHTRANLIKSIRIHFLRSKQTGEIVSLQVNPPSNGTGLIHQTQSQMIESIRRSSPETGHLMEIKDCMLSNLGKGVCTDSILGFFINYLQLAGDEDREGDQAELQFLFNSAETYAALHCNGQFGDFEVCSDNWPF